MNILHIHSSMASGGVEAMICGLANEMSKNNNVTVCSIFAPRETDVFWKKLSSKVTRESLGKRKGGFSLSEIFKIYKFIKRRNFDVVNLHGFFYYYLFSVFILHKKIKFIYTVHSDAIKENTKWDKRLFFIKKLFFKLKWIHPITISENSKVSFTRLYGIESKLIYNGIEQIDITNNSIIKNYKVSPKTKVFIHAGRISKEKNQVVLCQSFNKLINEGHDVVLLIVGAKQNEEIFNLIHPYFNQRIKYLGERGDVIAHMANCDAMCLPSIWEGLPVTLLESLSVGCIPICTPVGGIPNVIKDNYNGLLSKSNSETDYYDTLKRFLKMKTDEVIKMKSVCIRSFEKYDIVNTANEYLEFYKEIYCS